MAQFDTTINILVKAQEAFKTVAKLEDKINKLNNPTTRKQVASVVREDKQKVKNAEKQLSTEVRLSAAAQRRATVEKALNRAGISNNKAAEARVKALQKAGDAGEGILSIQNAVNAGLEKELQIRRELNRTQLGKEKGQRDLAKANERINRLSNSGLTDGSLKKVRETRDKFSSAVGKGELDEAKRLNAQLRQKLFLLERVQKAQEAQAKEIAKLAKAGGPSSPLRARSILGSDDAIRAKAKYYDQIAKSVKAISSPMRAQSVLGSDEAIRAKAKYYDQIAKSVKAISSPMRAQSVLGSDDAIRKKAEYYERIAKSVKPLSSPMRAQSVLGSDAALRKKAEYYDRIAKSAKTTAGARSPIRGSKDIPGSPKYIEAAAKAEKTRTKEVEKRAKAEERAANAEKTAAASKRKSKFQDVALGVGFPLLFGGGPGSVIGGALGGIFGGMGGSVLGGALGQQFDKLGAAALETGKAFNKVTSNLDAIIPRLGRGASEGFSGRARFLTEQGLGSQVGTEALNVFEDVYGAGTLKRIQELGQTNKEWDQTMQELGIRLQDFISGPLAGLLAAIQKVSGAGVPTPDEKTRANRQARIDGFQSEIDRLTPLQGKAGSVDGNFQLKQQLSDATTNLALEKAIQDDINEGRKTSTNLQDLSLALAKRTAEVEAASIDLVRNKLTARRDTLAADKGALAVQQEQNKLQTLQNQLSEEENRITKDTYLIAKLKQEVTASEAELKRQELARANAILEAERQITREVSANNQAAGQAYGASLTLIQQLKDITQSQTVSYGQQQQLLTTQFNLNKAILAERQRMELLGKTELEVIDSINKKYVQLNQQEERRLALQKEMARQAEVMRRDREQEIIDARELTKLEAERSAALKIRSMDVGRKYELAGTGFGFFGDSANFEEETLAKSAAQLESYNEQIAKLQARVTNLRDAEKIDFETLIPIEDALKDVTSLRDSFQELQPAIDGAAIKQAQFNDAFNAVSPIVQGITSNLTEVVKGTKSVEEAFVDMLANIGQAFVDMATQILAQKAAMMLLQAFTGGSPLPTTGTKPGLPFFEARTPGLASGGAAIGNKPYLVGETGPELFVPQTSGRVVNNSDSQMALDRYSYQDNSPTQLSQPIKIEYTSTSMAGEEYVTTAQFQQGIAAAAKQGAKSGETRVMASLRNSRSRRKSIGI